MDYIALYKFNYFHIHLTEDQGWRFESKLYPKLTIKGCKRSHTNFGFKKEEGFYTQEQLKELVDYCHKRYIKVIPEIDMPGHTMSALACYPELSCFDRKLKVSTHWGIKFDIMCAGKDFTYKFCKDIIDELCEIFTDEYIHIGGDEALKLRWSMCEHCKKKLAEHFNPKFCNKINIKRQFFQKFIIISFALTTPKNFAYCKNSWKHINNYVVQ